MRLATYGKRFHGIDVVRQAMLVALMLLTAPAWPAEPAGKVLFATGRATIVDAAGDSRPMERRGPVFPGDQLVTGEGRAQVRLSDGSAYSLEPFTRFRVDEYRYQDNAAALAKRAFFTLLKGGFRALTGAVGKEREENYRVRTALADIGIRGTAYRASLTFDGGAVAHRLDVAVSAGTVFLINDAGMLDIAAGQAGFATGRDLPPALARSSAGDSAGRDAASVVPDLRDAEQRPVDPFPEHHHEPEPVIEPHPPSPPMY